MRVLLLPLMILQAYGEYVWLGLIAVSPWLFRKRLKRRWLLGCWAGAVCCVFLLHLLGLKFYGRPVLRDNQVLDHGMPVTGIAAPGTVTFEGGTTQRLAGLAVLKSMDKAETERAFFSYPVLAEPAGSDDGESRVFWQDRIKGWCGNTWFPRFFPRPVSANRKEEMGLYLVRRGLAIPRSDILDTDREYGLKLLGVLQMAVQGLDVAGHEEEACGLAQKILGDCPEHGPTALWLMVKAKQEGVAGKAVEMVEGLMATRKSRNLYHQKKAVVPYFDVLVEVSPEAAKEQALQIINGFPDDNPYLKVALAKKMLDLGDWQGLDSIMDQFADESLHQHYRNSYKTDLRGLFQLHPGRPPGDRHGKAQKGDIEWYHQIRPRLRWNSKVGRFELGTRSTEPKQ